MLSFANYSNALYASARGHEPESNLIDYSQVVFSTDVEQLELLGRRLGRVSIEIERELGGAPQDIEGAIVFDQNVNKGRAPATYQIYIVQTRNQV